MRGWQWCGGQMWSGDRADRSCFTSSLFPFHFISPWMLARGAEGINEKSSFILKNGLAPFYTELKAPRLKRWQRREQGGVPERDLGASPSSQPASRSAVGTARGQGRWVWRWPLHNIPLRRFLARTWSEGHGGGREWGPQCHRNRDRESWHMQAGDRRPRHHRNKGAQHRQEEHWDPSGMGTGTREPCPRREGTGDPNGMGMGTRDPEHAGEGSGTSTLQKRGAGTQACTGGGQGTRLPWGWGHRRTQAGDQGS